MSADISVDYSGHFWGEKHHGYHVLYENMKHGEDTVNEVVHFVKERLSMEEEYGKTLLKSVNRVSSFITNGSSIDSGWALTKGTLELLADIHVMMVKNLQDLSKEITKYKEDLAKSRKEAKQQDVIDAVNLMQTTTTCLQKSKETYHSRCSELDKLRKDSNANHKELSKMESKMIKARDEYRGYIEKYEIVRADFEDKMSRACKIFQAHDRSHYAALQQFLLLYASYHQETASASQQVCAQFRESIQHLNIEEMILRFIKKKGTGSDRPQPAMFEECADVSMADDDGSLGHLLVSSNCVSAPSSCSSSTVMPISGPHLPSSADHLLSLEPLDTWNEKKNDQVSPTASISSDSTAGGVPPISSVFSSSVGANRQKLSLFLPKRKKTVSQSSVGDDLGDTSSGLFKFRQNRRSKKSSADTNCATEKADGFSMDDVQSTASSSRSEDKHINGSSNLVDMQVAPPPAVDEEGYTIRNVEQEKEDTNWSSCSSSDEDENEMQQSKIRSLTIRPADSSHTMNASVDELRDAIGHISIGRSNTFDKDPWSTACSRPPLFSQSLCSGSLKPLRPAHTAEGRFRSNFSESEFSRSDIPLNFSASMGPLAGMARARPRSNTPTHNPAFFGQSSFLNKDVGGSTDWGSSFAMNYSESSSSLGESTFNLSQSTANLMQATISEQRVPVAMAINEYSHVWFKGADISQRTQRTFGTIMISFAASSLPLLTDIHSDLESLQFNLTDSASIKAVLPNKQLLLPTSTSSQLVSSCLYSFDRLGLANWLLAQQKERPNAAFYNAEVIRYELADGNQINEPPLLLTSYWKCEPDHTDIRIDYRLNSDGPISSALLNLVFSTKISGVVSSITSDPHANWSADASTLSWSVTELSIHGDCSGSLKARVLLSDGGPSQPAHVYAQFQSLDATISGVGISLVSSDTYHLSMIRRKILAGKYFCEPEVRK